MKNPSQKMSKKRQGEERKRAIIGAIYDIETIFGEWFVKSDFERDELSYAGKLNLADILENLIQSLTKTDSQKEEEIRREVLEEVIERIKYELDLSSQTNLDEDIRWKRKGGSLRVDFILNVLNELKTKK